MANCFGLMGYSRSGILLPTIGVNYNHKVITAWYGMEVGKHFINETRTCLQRHSVLLAWRLDREMRRRSIYTKQDLRAKVFLPPTVSTSKLFTCLWIDLVRLLTLTRYMSTVAGYKKNSRASIPEKWHHCQRSKKWFTWHVISIIAENKLHSHHKNHLHTMKVYNTQSSELS